MITVAVVGGWHVHARDYAQRAREHPDTELVAVWDDDSERGRTLAAEFGVAYADDLDTLLARDDLDAVTVTTATADHHAVITAAASARKHIFTEKLLAPTVAEALDVIGVADRNDVVLLVSLPRLALGSTAEITDLLDRGELGEADVRAGPAGPRRRVAGLAARTVLRSSGRDRRCAHRPGCSPGLSGAAISRVDSGVGQRHVRPPRRSAAGGQRGGHARLPRRGARGDRGELRRRLNVRDRARRDGRVAALSSRGPASG